MVTKKGKISGTTVGLTFFAIGAILFILQQVWGVFHFPSNWDRKIFVFVVMIILSIGLTGIVGEPGDPLTWIKDWFICMLCIAGVFMTLNAFGILADSSTSTTYYQGDYFYLLDGIGSRLISFAGTAKTVLLICMPIAISVFTVIMMLIGDRTQNRWMVLLRGIICVVIILVLSYLSHLTIGINIFKTF